MCRYLAHCGHQPIDRIAERALGVVADQMSLGLQVVDDRLDRIALFELPAQDTGDTTSLPGQVHGRARDRMTVNSHA
jgi:hypothetical protein